MSFFEANGLRYYSFEIFEGLPIQQAVFTRHGGVSPNPWESLNVGGTNGDDRQHVVENRWRLFNAFGRRVESLFDVWQVHGTDVIATDQPRPLDAPHRQADIIMTDRLEVTLFMRFGDCVPLLLYDPTHHAIALAHSGWIGTVHNVASVAVQAMADQYGTRPEDILAGIGPSIGVDHYEVGENVIDAVQNSFGEDAAGLLPVYNGSKHFDLWEANRLIFEQTGIRHIQVSGVCTACHVDDWFSHRAEKGKTGRFGAVFALDNGAGRG